jgi:hypothetical protein
MYTVRVHLHTPEGNQTECAVRQFRFNFPALQEWMSLSGNNASTRYLFPSILVRGKFALMTRLARMVVSGLPHHVTQPGNRRESIFFEDGDQEICRDLRSKD